MKATFSISYFIQKTKSRADGMAPILARLTINSEFIHFSVREFVLPEHWDAVTHRTIGKTTEERKTNKVLDNMASAVYRHYYDLQNAGEIITAGKIKSLIFSTDEKKHLTIGKLFDLFIFDYEKLVLTQDYGKESLFRYKVNRDRVMTFIKHEYKTNDLPLADLDKRFLDKLYLWLRSETHINNNTAVKFMHRFSSVYKMARDNGWVSGDPCKLQNLHLDKVDRGYLTKEQLDTVMSKELESERLEKVRDVFVFCCFTGLPYIDCFKLTKKDLKVWSDGSLWLSLHRHSYMDEPCTSPAHGWDAG